MLELLMSDLQTPLYAGVHIIPDQNYARRPMSGVPDGAQPGHINSTLGIKLEKPVPSGKRAWGSQDRKSKKQAGAGAGPVQGMPTPLLEVIEQHALPYQPLPSPTLLNL
eukprot:1159211-Pelagomonas_calceolata.AAC.3